MKRFCFIVFISLIGICLLVSCSQSTAEGKAGENAEWSFYEKKGLLTISGKGRLDDDLSEQFFDSMKG